MMDFYKLKLDKYKQIGVENLPPAVVLPFEPVTGSLDCLVAFVQTEDQVNRAILRVMEHGVDTALVLAYPKGTSKSLTSEVNRDSIVALIKATGVFKAPRLVSLDKDWSGFSFKYAGTGG